MKQTLDLHSKIFLKMKKVWITLVIRLFFWPHLGNKTTLRDQCVVRDLFEKSFCFVREAKLIFCQAAVAIQANKQEFVRQKVSEIRFLFAIHLMQTLTSPFSTTLSAKFIDPL